MKNFVLAVLLCLLAPTLQAEDRSLHLAIGDPVRKDKEVALVLDGVADTRKGDVVTPAEMVKRLAGARLVLVGESHTDMEFHRAQLRVVEELVRAGRPVFLGLEMYPYTEQRFLDQWVDGLLTEEGFLKLSRWYENWGYNWSYYRDIFLFARDHKVRMFAVNAPRDVVSAVRKKGFQNLTPEEAAHIPSKIDSSSPDHRALFKSFFDADDPLHSGMTEEQWGSMISAQATWDATMAHNAVKALQEHGTPETVLVVLAGSGHVAYGVGIERQARTYFPEAIATVIPVNVRDEDGTEVKAVQASYADFIWGVPAETAPLYPSLGLSTMPAEGERALKVIFVSEKTLAEKAGFKAGDVLLTMDGTPVPDKETLNRLMAGRSWGDESVFTVRRGAETATLRAAFRR